MKDLLPRAVLILLFFFFLIAGLYYARGFLIPVAFAGVLSMLLLPISLKLEKKGINKVLSIILCILLLIGIVTGLGFLLFWQVSDLTSDISHVEQKVRQFISEVQQYINKTFGISPEEQNKIIEKQQSTSSNVGSLGSSVFGILGGLLTNTLLVLVYIFLFMYFRTHLKTFILKLVPETKKRKAINAIEASRNVAQKYISGVAMMIVCLWIMYGIGFSLIGVKNALFFAVLCGLLEIVPFIGNLTGNALTIIMVLVQGGGTSMIIGIVITYAIIQFVQTYLLEPLVVGAEVNINPLFTIMVIVVGEMVWGIPGMILAIPLLGIVKIICDNIEPLKPYAYLIGESKKKEQGSFIKKIKGWLR